MSTKLLDLVNITKSYDGVTILDDLNPVSYTHLTLPTTSRV